MKKTDLTPTLFTFINGATEYKHGHGSKAGEEGYWFMWVATGEFDVQGRHVKPGVDRGFSPTPPPPKCDGST